MDRRILLAVAFILGATGVYGLLTSMNKEVETQVVDAPPVPAMTEVWITNHPVKKGEKINPVVLKATSVLTETAREAGVTGEARFEMQEGAVAGIDFAQGTIIAENQLLLPGQSEYMELLLGPNRVPYPISFEGHDAMVTMIAPGDYVDVMLIASVDENLAEGNNLNSFEGLSVTPLLKKCRVLEVNAPASSGGNSTVVISLAKKEVSRMMIARRIGVLDVYKSGQSPLPEAHVSDVLKDFTSVTELRGDQHRADERVAF